VGEGEGRGEGGECHQGNQSRSAKAGVEDASRQSVSRKAGVADKEAASFAEPAEQETKKTAAREGISRSEKRDGEKAGETSRTFVAIIIMVGRSCNAGAYATEWRRVAGWGALIGCLLCTDYTFSFSLFLSLSLSPSVSFLSLSLCFPFFPCMFPPSLSLSLSLSLSVCLSVCLSHYASTMVLSRTLEAGLARGQVVDSRFCRSSYVSPRDGRARV